MQVAAPASRYPFTNFGVKKNRIPALLPLLKSSECIRNTVTSLTLGSGHIPHAALLFPPHIPEDFIQFTCGLEEVLAIIALLPRLRRVDMKGLSLNSVLDQHSLDDIQNMHLDLEVLHMVDIWNFLFDPSTIIHFFSAFDIIHGMWFEFTPAFPMPANIPTSLPQDCILFRPVAIRSLILICSRSLPFLWMADMFEAICASDKMTHLQLHCHSENGEATLSFYHRLLPRFKYLKELLINVPLLFWSFYGRNLRGMCLSHFSPTNRC